MEEKGNYPSHGSCFYICKLPRTLGTRLVDLRSITEINYHPPVSIQKVLFSNQSLTKDVQWNQTRRAITIQEGVSIAKGGQESIK